jgi:hypothetical protein
VDREGADRLIHVLAELIKNWEKDAVEMGLVDDPFGKGVLTGGQSLFYFINGYLNAAFGEDN